MSACKIITNENAVVCAHTYVYFTSPQQQPRVLQKIANKRVVFRYYDSLQEDLHKACMWKAQYLVTALIEAGPEYLQGWTFPTEFPIAEEVWTMSRTNVRSRQVNDVDCAVFAGHFWEGEVRRVLGQGWAVPFPSPLVIEKMRLRVVKLVTQLRKLHEEDEKKKLMAVAKAAAKPKGKKLAVAEVAVVEDAEPAAEAKKCLNLNSSASVNTQLQLADLAWLSRMTIDQGIVPFYGCSKCRYSRGGCIFWMCNPEKFEAHYMKFPEKYLPGTKIMRPEAEKTLLREELHG